MSDWLRDQQSPYSSGEANPPATGPEPDAENTTPEAPNVETPEPVTQPVQPPVPPVETGWSSPGWSTPPVTSPQAPSVPTPPADPASETPARPSDGWQTGRVSYGGQQPVTPPPTSWPPNTTSPYGWNQQPSATPPQKPPKKRWSGTGVLIAVLGVVCAVSLIAAAALLGYMDGGEPPLGGSSSGGSGSSQTTDGEVPQIVTKEPQEEGLLTRDIVKQNLDSTVVITMYTKNSGGYFTQESLEQVAGVASGIIWTKDGYIITNAHCVYNDKTQSTYSRIAVTLYDGTEYEAATIVGYDVATDLAVIRVDADNLVPADFGDSDALQLGDRVVVLGNNSGLGWSVTEGCVSGLARDVYEETNYAIKCLQTDATINPGNSGGPLLNTSGQVVGINSAKIVAEGYEGLGFSIPIKEATPILENLVEYGYAKGRVKLGITGRTISFTGFEGFQIESIAEDSSLAGTGAKSGDIITYVNGVRVKSYEEMRNELTKHAVGEQVTLTLLRVESAGRSNAFDIRVTLQESADSV